MESILTLDRLRQSVAVKELEQVRGPALSMRKTASVPNFSQVKYRPRKLPRLRFLVRIVVGVIVAINVVADIHSCQATRLASHLKELFYR